jgi:formylmethanofuran dehydrogenase subunit E
MNIEGKPEWWRMFKEVAQHHGDECVGLAIGVRALAKVNELLGPIRQSEDLSVIAGTKNCLTEPFKHLLGIPGTRIEVKPVRDETLTVIRGEDRVKFHVSKRKFETPEAVFDATESEVFPLIERATPQAP